MLRIINITPDEFAVFSGTIFLKADTEVDKEKDFVLLQEVDEKKKPTGLQTYFKITSVVEPSRANGIKKGYVIAGLKRIKDPFKSLTKEVSEEVVEDAN